MTDLARLYILDFGLFEVFGDGENGRLIGIPGYLIQTKNGRNLLVDTGFHPKYAQNPEQAAIEDGLTSFGRVVQLTEANLVTGQLALLGLTPSDIDTLILTHGDIDHVGGVDQFPQAEIMVPAAEKAFAQPRYWNGRSPINWPNNPYRLIDNDTNLLPGLTLINTPGHSPGHLSLLLHLPQTGAVLLTCDAISRPAEIGEGFAGAWDAIQAQTSASKLMTIAENENAFVIYGHDPIQWTILKKAPMTFQ